ncbi:hypothetical protein [Robiginitalea aurantiaca]|uniref:YARHG domain-containing protein n=1 Tax=Robiginitalea aurantiaca TaxID=3056915 RepID=A0ABT7WB49_9FLAO|nr:hypothetical protein [Robiginitalea aurantiaca]MDM9630137.1 hypothetical protein [Robiginitalea aurantiaca]
MKNQILALIVLQFFIFSDLATGQEMAQKSPDNETTVLFQDETPLSVVLRYSDKEMRRDTDDSTYLKTQLAYQNSSGQWDSLEIRLRARGNWRRKNCFLTPVKMRIQKSEMKGTEFEGNKELKLVLPCRNSDQGHDYVLKEYMAYKLFEVISPYHFKTRRLQIAYSDLKGKKDKTYDLEGFVIEDISEVAERCKAKRLKRTVHPLQQDDRTSIENDFFQFMIGNTDYSSAYQHNEKLIFVEGMNAIPVPYDFDMSGLVDANYAVVSQVQGETLNITDVRTRLYRGFKRNPALYEEVRQEYLSKKPEFMKVVDDLEPSFKSEKDFEDAKSYILEFFDILQDKSKFNSRILNKARTK